LSATAYVILAVFLDDNAGGECFIVGIDVQGSGPPVQLIPLNKVHHLLPSDLNAQCGSGVTTSRGV